MKRFLWLLLMAGLATPAFSQTHAFNGMCEQGGVSAAVSGLNSTNKLDGIIPSCTVSVYFSGTTTLAPIYAASTGTGSVAGVTITAGGSYSACPTGVTFTGGSGTGAAGLPVCTGTAITGVLITNGGTGYTSAPTVGFTGGTGSGGTATANLAQTLSNPFTAAALGSVAPGQWLFYAADGTPYDVTMSGGISPLTYNAPVTLTGLIHTAGAGGGGGGGCGPLVGDATSTNCGTGNRVTDTSTVPAYIQTYGDANMVTNDSAHAVSVGDANLDNVENVFGGSSQLVSVGSGNGDHIYGASSDMILVGDKNWTGGSGTGAGASGNVICIGQQNCTNMYHVQSVIGIGFEAATDFPNNSGSGQSSDILAMGWGVASSNNPPYVFSSNTSEIFVYGENSLQPAQTGATAKADFSIIALGEGSGHVLGTNVNDIVIAGDEPASALPDNSHDIVAFGNGADHQCESFTFTGCGPGQPNPVAHNDVVFIGDGPGLYNQGSFNVGIGTQILGVGATSNHNSGTDNTAVGGRNVLVANTTGINNTAYGSYAGSDGFVLQPSIVLGNSNQTGSNNTWIGYDSGPNVTTQLSNTIALGYQAHNGASNQTVIGNSSITSLKIFGCPTGQSALDDGSGTCYVPGTSSFITSLTTTGTSGPATVVSGVLNIPQYSGGSGAVSSVSNSDGTLTISPTTGAVVASIALGHANTWTATQTFSGIIDSAISAGTAPICPNGTGGAFTTTGCSGAASGAWSSLTNPTGNLGLTMGADTSTFTYNAATGSSDLWSLTDTVGNTGTGIMFHLHPASGSGETPFQADANGVGWKVGTDGSLASVGATVAGTMDWGQGTAPGAAPATSIQMYAPTSVTGYNLVLPGTVATSGNTFLSCTAASPSVCSWAAGGGLTNPMTAVGDMIVGGTAGAPTRLALTAPGGGGVILAATGFATSPGWLSFENGTGTIAFGASANGNSNTIFGLSTGGTGNSVVAVGNGSGFNGNSDNMTTVGAGAMGNVGSQADKDSTAVGFGAGPTSKTCNQCGFFGSQATASVTGLTNAWAYGFNMSVGTSNTQIFGNSSIVSTILQGFTQFPALESTGTVFTVSACGTPTATGGAAAGTFAAGSATCNPVITPGYTAAHGWTCVLQDETTAAASFRQSAHSTTTATLAGTGVVSSDVIDVMCMAY